MCVPYLKAGIDKNSFTHKFQHAIAWQSFCRAYTYDMPTLLQQFCNGLAAGVACSDAY